MKYNTEYEKNERKVRLFMFIKNKPYRNLKLAIDNLLKVFLNVLTKNKR